MRKGLGIVVGWALLAGVWCPPVDAQTPACGTVIDTPGAVVTFDSDMVCPAGFTGTALMVQADNVTVNGAGFGISGADAQTLVSLSGASTITLTNLRAVGNGGNGVSLTSVSNSTISGVDASGTGGTGIGFKMVSSSGNLISDNTVHGRGSGIRIEGNDSDNTFVGNNLTDNVYGIDYGYGHPRSNNAFTNNDVSRSSAWGMVLGHQSGFSLSGNNFTDSANGLYLAYMDSITLTGLDFSSFNILGVVVRLNVVSNSTISGVDASGTAGTGTGFQMVSSSGNLISNNTVHGRGSGIRIEGNDSDNTLVGNNLSDNVYGIDYGYGHPRSNNTFTNNDVSRSSAWGMVLGYQSGFSLSGNNFTDSANGLYLAYMDSITLTGLDFSSFNIPGVVVRLNVVSNSTISGVDASGTGGTGIGFKMVSSSGNLISNNTVHGRGSGIRIEGNDSDNTFVGNNLTDNVYGIDYGYGHPRSNNAFTNNDVSRSSAGGIVLGYQDQGLLRQNIVADCQKGIWLVNGGDNVVAENEIVAAGSVGLELTNQANALVKENVISQGTGDGLMLVNAADARVYHNNIYGNAGWQVSSDQPIELSYGNEGNYWGRSCLDEPFEGLFVAGADSNSLDVVDSHAFGGEDAWLNGLDPGCGPPPPGTVLGAVTDGAGGVASVSINLFDSGGGFLEEAVTATDGTYTFGEWEPGIYSVSLIEPIGYAATSPTEVEAIVDSGEETIVDFTLERLVLEVDTRSMGYWKHQAKANVTGKGRAQESSEALLGYLEDLQEQYDVFDAVNGLEGLYGVLEPPKPPTMRERTEQHLMALLLNLSSLRIATYTVVSFDDTAGEAIDFILAILANPGSVKDELEYAKDLAEDINNGLIPFDPERIPDPIE